MMKRFLAFLLSFMLLLTPAVSCAQGSSLSTEKVLQSLGRRVHQLMNSANPGLSAYVTSPEGETVSFGAGSAANGHSAFLTAHDASLLTDGQTLYLTKGDRAYSTSLAEFASLVGGLPIPAFSPEDLDVLAAAGQELLMRLLTSSALTVQTQGEALALRLDVDALLKALDEQIPAVLTAHRTQLDALLAKYAPLLGLQGLQVARLIDMLRSAGLQNIRTGVEVYIAAAPTPDGFLLSASCMDWIFQINLTDSGFAASVTTPEGTAYPFDTNDLMTLMQVLAFADIHITPEAFTLQQTTGEQDGSKLLTTTITTDLALLERDIKLALTQAVTANQPVLDALGAKYQPWADLLCPYTSVSTDGTVTAHAAPVLSAAWLAGEINSLQLFPAVKGELIIQSYPDKGTVDIYGFLGNVLLDAHLLGLDSSSITFEASLRVPDEDFALMLSGSAGARDLTFTLSCSRDLGGFKAITFSRQQPSQRSGGASGVSLTTDTDLIHFVLSSASQAETLDVKLGEFLLTWEQCLNPRPGKPNMRLNASWADGFLSAELGESLISLDSSLGGVRLTMNSNALVLNGYLVENPYRQTLSTFQGMIDARNETISLSVLPANGDSVFLNYETGKLSVRSGGHVLLVEDMGGGNSRTNLTRISLDGQTLTTIKTLIISNEFSFTCYPGDDLTAKAWNLCLCFGGRSMPIPVNAVPVSAEQFISLAEAALSGAPAEALVTSTPAITPIPTPVPTPVPTEPVNTMPDNLTYLDSTMGDGLFGE